MANWLFSSREHAVSPISSIAKVNGRNDSRHTATISVSASARRALHQHTPCNRLGNMNQHGHRSVLLCCSTVARCTRMSLGVPTHDMAPTPSHTPHRTSSMEGSSQCRGVHGPARHMYVPEDWNQKQGTVQYSLKFVVAVGDGRPRNTGGACRARYIKIDLLLADFFS